MLMLRLSKGKRASGRIKSAPEDFIVEEITENGSILGKDRIYSASELASHEEQDGKFSIFVMQKRNWNTPQALKAIARRFRKGIKSTGFAGTKDRISVSTQLCSIFGVRPEQLSELRIKDISINGAWKGSDKIKMGELLGNRFKITVRDTADYESVPNLISELNGIFPNYYGEQRFGSRKINFGIGIDILRKDFRNAAMRFLTETQNEINEEAISARERLGSELDFKAALRYFPAFLKYERSMIEYLAKYPNNYANAIRKIPRSISLMFVHSVEAQIFNAELEKRIKDESIEPKAGEPVCHEGSYGFTDISSITNFDASDKRRAFLVGNIIGYDTKLLTAFEKDMLDELGLTLESFKVEGLNELQSRGSSRVLFAPLKDISCKCEKENNALMIVFSLPAGSYATVLLGELLET